MLDVQIKPLTQDKFDEAVELVLRADLDTREEIEHHLKHLEANHIAVSPSDQVVGVIGWYQDNVNYANEAMGDKFPGEEAYWVGFFAVDSHYRGQGIGSRLLTHLEKVVKDLGSNQLWVSSVPESKTYYEQKGFKLVTTGKINDNQKFFLVKSL